VLAYCKSWVQLIKQHCETYILLGGTDKLGEQLLIRLRKAESVDIRCCGSEEGVTSKFHAVSGPSDSRKGVGN
jgi:hypothetical protein